MKDKFEPYELLINVCLRRDSMLDPNTVDRSFLSLFVLVIKIDTTITGQKVPLERFILLTLWDFIHRLKS